MTCANQICYVVAERRHDAFASCCPSSRLAQNLVILSNVKTIHVEPQMQTRRDIGNLVTLAGMIAIIAVTSVIIVGSLMGHSNVAVMPDWSERQLAQLGR